jgi:hypothetical protein
MIDSDAAGAASAAEPEEETEVVRFALDGVAYAIELPSAEAAEFRRLLAPFVRAARRVKTGKRGQAAKKRGRSGRVLGLAAANGRPVLRIAP